ncbi:hypothetical protein D9619_005078 [Psilocybe cf. subviscida]|uniref:Uncharacterized protein n=1 Tax=Psilocybe cf. subviscida TaxID=2480587 RepID=A0A8H5BRC2_9AGAR|nr:hypothetical protein D9619_005078 [Psilocybe cf. subviscida]
MQFKIILFASVLTAATSASAYLSCNTSGSTRRCTPSYHCIGATVTHIAGTPVVPPCLNACTCPYPSPPPTPPGHHHRRAVEYIDFDDLI